MENQKQKAIIVKNLGEIPVLEKYEIPQPAQNQVLIKVISSTINPSDRLRSEGSYDDVETPYIGGFQGFGEIIKAGSSSNDQLIGKKVSFTTQKGAWAQYTVANLDYIWQVDSDVPMQCAASGVINPLTAIGMVSTFKSCVNHGQKGKGLINTAAASSLGKMLNKLCLREGIPLLNVVRRKQQVKTLEEQGAKYILDTSNQNWVNQYKQLINAHGFNVLLDAIGGGEVTQKLIINLKPLSQVYVYGKLVSQPFSIKMPMFKLRGICISNFLLFQWYERTSTQERDEIKNQYSSLLKNQLATFSIKQVKLEEVPNIWQQAKKRSSQGKFTIKI